MTKRNKASRPVVGRPFVKGDPRAGRPHGAKDKLPRSGRACVNALVEAFGANEDLLREAILKGLSAKPPSSFPYLRMVVEHNVGAPEQPLSLTTKVVHEYHEAPPQR